MKLGWILICAMLCLPAMGDPNGADVDVVLWPMATDKVAEVRLGVELEGLEIYAAPRYDQALASEGDVATDIRVYGIYSALDADLAAKWFGLGVTLPAGDVYGGLFAGWEFQDGRLESGWLVGGRIDLGSNARYKIDLCTEYQYAWTARPGDTDRHEIVAGVRIQFK